VRRTNVSSRRSTVEGYLRNLTSYGGRGTDFGRSVPSILWRLPGARGDFSGA
jgi:hypothetical protein